MSFIIDFLRRIADRTRGPKITPAPLHNHTDDDNSYFNPYTDELGPNPYNSYTHITRGAIQDSYVVHNTHYIATRTKAQTQLCDGDITHSLPASPTGARHLPPTPRNLDQTSDRPQSEGPRRFEYPK